MAKNQYSDDYNAYSVSDDLNSELNQTVGDLKNTIDTVSDVANKANSLRSGWNGGNAVGSNDAGSLNYGNDKKGDSSGISDDHSSVSKENISHNSNKENDITDNARNVGKEVGKEAGKEVGKETAKETGKETAKLATKETGKSVAKGAAGAATGGVGLVLSEAVDFASKAKKGIDKAASGSSTSNKKQSSGLNGILIALAIITIVPCLFISAVTKTVGGTLAQYISDQAYNAAQTKQEIDSEEDKVYDNYEGQQNAPKKKSFYDGALKSAGGAFKKLAALLGIGSGEEDEDKEGPYDIANAYYEATTRSKEMIDDPILTKVRTHGAYGGQIEKDINIIINREGYDAELTWASFDADADIFEGMNYAEFLSVMTENESYNSENAKHEEIEELFKEKKKVRLLYRLYIEPATMTAQEAGRATPEYASTWNDSTNTYETDYSTVTNQAELDRLIKYGKVTLKRYYLRDLYEIFELDAYATNYEFENVSEILTTKNGQQNIEMLDRIEGTMRSYCDVSEDANAEELLGPSDRSEYDGEPTDTPIDDGDDQYEYTTDTPDTSEDETIVYESDESEITDVHGQIGAEIGDITEIAKLVAQKFVNINPSHPYGNGESVTGTYSWATVSLPWGSYNVSPCCASGTVLVAKYFGLKGGITSATSYVANSSYAGSRVSASSMSQLRVGDIITYGTSHTEIVTKIDGNSVYIAGFGSDTNIKKDAENGYNKVVSKSNAVSSLQFSSAAPTVWRPNENTFDFTE